MSKRKHLESKKESIKTIIIGLLLMIGISGLGCLGSYAYFSDKVEAENDLVVTMGNLKTDIEGDGFKDDILNPQDIEPDGITNEFYILNNGSLTQKATLYIKDVVSEDNKNLILTIKTENKTLFSGNLSEIPQDGIEIGEAIKPETNNNKLKCTINIKGKVNQYKGESLNFNLYVKGTQVK